MCGTAGGCLVSPWEKLPENGAHIKKSETERGEDTGRGEKTQEAEEEECGSSRECVRH